MQETLPKLSWFPLYIEKFLSSASWNEMKDYQRGWYIQLLLASANSARPGYLSSDGSLWLLAGAHSRQFFEKESALVLARFKSRQLDGRLWIYNERLLKTLEEQSDKQKCSASKMSGKTGKNGSRKSDNLSLSFSLVSSESLDQTVEDLFSFYLQLFNRDTRYKLTESRKRDCAARLVELLQQNGCELEAAREFAKEAMLNLSASEFHVEHGYVDWTDHIFKNQEILQKRLAMRIPPAAQSGNCDLHPDSGLTAWGSCGGCYFGSVA